MDVSDILRPEELDFEVPEDLAHAIDELIAALARDDQMNLDCYLDEVEGAARSVSEDDDAWVRWYYCDFGWRKTGRDAELCERFGTTLGEVEAYVERIEKGDFSGMGFGKPIDGRPHA